LNGAVCVAGGAPALARRTGAALLPVFTVQTGEDTFATVVEPPLTAAANLDHRSAVQALLTAYAAVLESYLKRWPDQFTRFRIDCDAAGRPGATAQAVSATGAGALTGSHTIGIFQA
jgi:hypothetical protein